VPAFPKLNSAALAQFPLTRTARFDTDVLHFTDGSEQRFRRAARASLGWSLDLSLLSEDEVARLLQFVEACAGARYAFDFQDPSSGTVHPGCRIADDLTAFQIDADLRGRGQLVIRKDAE